MSEFEESVAEMRRLQKLYFRTKRDAPDKKEIMMASIAAEKKVDEMLSTIGKESRLP